MPVTTLTHFSNSELDMLWFTECQLATLEQAAGKKRTPQCDLKRHTDIASQMLYRCYLYGFRGEYRHISERGRNLMCNRARALLRKFHETDGNKHYELMHSVVFLWMQGLRG